MNQKIYLPNNVSIMVNNLCNMTCSHCAGLALYDFLGTFEWNQFAERYKKWSEILETDTLSLCGGEPYLHPDLENWFDSVRSLWPNTPIEIMTNGTRLSKRIELSRKFIQDGNSCIVVSCHDADTFDNIYNDIEEILQPWKEKITKTESTNAGINSWRGISFFIEDKEVIKYQLVVDMVPPYHKKVENGTVYFEMGGDKEASYQKCPWKDAITFQHGILYKCPPVVNYGEAKTQVKYEEEAALILEQYKGCDPFDSQENIENFFNTLHQSISVCELCAFDKQEDTLSFSRKVVLDPSMKKKFRQFKIQEI